MLELVSFILITISTIALLVITVTLDKKLETLSDEITDLTVTHDVMALSGRKSTQVFKHQELMTYLVEIYKATVKKENQMPFVEDHLAENTRDALIYITGWESNDPKEVELVKQIKQEDLLSEYIKAQAVFDAYLNKTLHQIGYLKKREERIKRYKRIVILFSIVFNTVGLIIGFYATKISNNKTDAKNAEILNELKKIESMHEKFQSGVGSGEYVTKKYADTHPKTSVKETEKPKKK